MTSTGPQTAEQMKHYLQWRAETRPPEEPGWAVMLVPATDLEKMDPKALAWHNLTVVPFTSNMQQATCAVFAWLRAHPGTTLADLEKKLRSHKLGVGLVAGTKERERRAEAVRKARAEAEDDGDPLAIKKAAEVSDKLFVHDFYAPFAEQKHPLIVTMDARVDPDMRNAAVRRKRDKYGLSHTQNLNALRESGMPVPQPIAEVDTAGKKDLFPQHPVVLGEAKLVFYNQPKLSALMYADLRVAMDKAAKDYQRDVDEAIKEERDEPKPPQIRNQMIHRCEDGSVVMAHCLGMHPASQWGTMLGNRTGPDGQRQQRIVSISDKRSWTGFATAEEMAARRAKVQKELDDEDEPLLHLMKETEQ